MMMNAKIKDKLSLVSLIAANLVPLAGVLFFGWDLAGLIFFYWCENLAVGYYAMRKIWTAQGLGLGQIKVDASSFWRKFRLIPLLFFCLHYGTFTLIHGGFVWNIFGSPAMPWYQLLIGIAGVFLSHGISYAENYIGKEEYKRISPFEAMFLPYRRLAVMHVVILVGGALLAKLGTPQLAVVGLVLGKIAIDQYFHRKEHGLIVGMFESRGFHTSQKALEGDWQLPPGFPEDFKNCRPGAVYVSPMILGKVVKYEIIGPKDGRCEMNMCFTKAANPQWDGKSLTCRYDNSRPFLEAVTELSDAFQNNSKMQCQGELFEVMKNPR